MGIAKHWPWAERQEELLEATDIGDSSLREIEESYRSMNEGFEIYGKWLLRYLADVGLSGIVLDVGCGNGFVAEQILASFPAVDEIVGIDINPIAIEQALVRTNSKLSVRLVNVYNLERVFQTESFDVVLVIDTLHHLENPEAALRQISYVLRPSGKVIVFEVARNAIGWLLAKVLRFVGVIPSDDFRKSVLRGYNQTELRGLFERVDSLDSAKIELVAKHFNAATAQKGISVA